MKFSIFAFEKNFYILHGHVFVMVNRSMLKCYLDVIMLEEPYLFHDEFQLVIVSHSSQLFKREAVVYVTVIHKHFHGNQII